MDIVEQLRSNADERFAVWQVVTTMKDAADEIERLREENATLKSIVINMVGKDFEHVKVFKPKPKRPSTKGQ